jgi:hypothetical protein
VIIESGADIDPVGKKSRSTIDQAARLGFDCIVRLLLEHKADVDGCSDRIRRYSNHDCGGFMPFVHCEVRPSYDKMMLWR